MTSTISRIIITGAGRGIGREIALNLAASGRSFALIARTKSELQATAGDLAQRGAVAHVIAADIAGSAEAEKAAGTSLDALGGVDALINGAGFSRAAPLVKTETTLFDDMYALNVRAAFIFMKAVTPPMKAQGFGRVVNVASISGLHGYPYITAYCASKHALVGLTRAAAAELGKTGITINAVCPGYVETEMLARTIENIVKTTGRTPREARAALEAVNPQRRIFTATEVAATAAFLLSEGAHGINGQCLAICGGQTV